MAETRAASRIGAEIIPAGIVGHEHNDVGALFLRLCQADEPRRGQGYPHGESAEDGTKIIAHGRDPF